jgi:hypothetical protein
MTIPRQLVLHLRVSGHTWSNPQQLLRSRSVTRYTTSTIAQRLVKAWRSPLPSGTCIHGNRHTYSSWTWDWTNLLRAPAKSKSTRRRWKLPRPNGEDIVQVLIYMAILEAICYYFLGWYEYQVVAKESHSPTMSIITVRRSTPDKKNGVFCSRYLYSV